MNSFGDEKYMNTSYGCKNGSKGILCAQCDDGYARGYDGACNKCPFTGGYVFLLYFGISLPFILISYLVYRYLYQNLISKIDADEMGKLYASIIGMLKIMFSFYQILSQFPVTISIDWPKVLKSILKATGLISSVEVLQLPLFGCMIKTTFYSQFFFTAGNHILFSSYLYLFYLIKISFWLIISFMSC